MKRILRSSVCGLVGFDCKTSSEGSKIVHVRWNSVIALWIWFSNAPLSSILPNDSICQSSFINVTINMIIDDRAAGQRRRQRTTLRVSALRKSIIASPPHLGKFGITHYYVASTTRLSNGNGAAFAPSQTADALAVAAWCNVIQFRLPLFIHSPRMSNSFSIHNILYRALANNFFESLRTCSRSKKIVSLAKPATDFKKVISPVSIIRIVSFSNKD